MSAEIACKQNILVTDFHLLKLLLVVLGFGSQTNVCGFSRQNICSEPQGAQTSGIHGYELGPRNFEIVHVFNYCTHLC